MPGAQITQATDRELAALAQSLPLHDPRRAAACEELITRYESIIRSCVRRYRDSPGPADDLMQVGYAGLLKAILNFDPEVGESLAAYARPCVSGEIKRHFRDRRWTVRVSRQTQELRLQIRAAWVMLPKNRIRSSRCIRSRTSAMPSHRELRCRQVRRG